MPIGQIPYIKKQLKEGQAKFYLRLSRLQHIAFFLRPEKQFEKTGYKEFKQELAELLIKKLEPFRQRQKQILKNPEAIEKILQDGAQKAQKIAQENMRRIKQNMGLV